jgi:hypothetical protein
MNTAVITQHPAVRRAARVIRMAAVNHINGFLAEAGGHVEEAAVSLIASGVDAAQAKVSESMTLD